MCWDWCMARPGDVEVKLFVLVGSYSYVGYT